MKSRKIITNILVWLPALLLTLSATAKFAGAAVIVNNLTKAGIVPYFPLQALGLLELTCVVLYGMAQRPDCQIFMCNCFVMTRNQRRSH